MLMCYEYRAKKQDMPTTITVFTRMLGEPTQVIVCNVSQTRVALSMFIREPVRMLCKMIHALF